MKQREEWPEWTDPTGNVYRPGDLIAVAIINGRSPQLVIAEVLRINKFNSKGEEITDTRYDWNTSTRTTNPSCTVTCQPLKDGRGFHRSKEAKVVTYQFPGNIVKVNPAPDWLD